MGHTKGKWKAKNASDDKTAIAIRGNGKIIATVWISKYFKDCPPIEQAEANAKLIESAPELFKAVQSFLEISESKEDFDTKTDMMISAIVLSGSLPVKKLLICFAISTGLFAFGCTLFGIYDPILIGWSCVFVLIIGIIFFTLPSHLNPISANCL